VKAVLVTEHGGPEVMRVQALPLPVAKSGEALVRVEAAGVNFIDILQRSGLYKVRLPLPMGLEGAGVVEAVTSTGTELAVGDRVAWTGIPGSYASHAIVPANRLVLIPAALTFEQAAAAMLQGMTAHYLASSTYPLKPGDTCLVHAGAGGVGLLLTQIAKMRGARVITTVSTEAKAALSRQAGADEVVLYTQQDFEAEVKRLTNGRGVHVAYDSVGQSTFMKSLNSLAPRGLLALYGQSSGAVPPIDPLLLSQKGSLFLTRPTLVTYVADRSELEQRARDIFSWIEAGKLRLRTEFEFPLEQAGAAHRALEGRQTTGKVLLIP
jgi:NADPH2:quinone reductase